MSTNRIQIGQLLAHPPAPPQPPAQKADSADPMMATHFASADSNQFPNLHRPAFAKPDVALSNHAPRLFLPLHYEPNYKYPLIVWLHSSGDDSTQLLRVMPSLSLRNYVGVGPTGSMGNSSQGFQWSQSPSGISAAVERVSQAIDHAQIKASIRPDRIFLAGFGNGGTMAMRVGFELSHVIAGALSFNGPLPQGMTPLRSWISCRKVPLFWSHGRKSEEFDESQLCDQLKLLHIAGFNVTLRQYPYGDELPASALADANRWIMESIASAIV